MRCVCRSLFVSRLIIGLTAGGLTMVSVVSMASAQAAKAKKKPSPKDLKTARGAYDNGTKFFESGDYSAAVFEFKKANSLVPSPNAEYWIAQSLDKLDRKDEAIEAYQTLLDNPDSAKVGQEKLDTAKARIEALKAPPKAEEPTPAPKTEEPAAEPPPPPPASEPLPESPPEPSEQAAPPESEGGNDLTPKNNLYELGIFTGPLFFSRAHNLQEEKYTRRAYGRPGWL
ncbi:MAG TPA: hypothetical protein VGP93_08200, partial [Polyangiaceae bacterium]|nr:hypothetical protein [Polyangiaceae bacterium]